MDAAGSRRPPSDLMLDALSGALFGVFIVILLLEYLNLPRGIPYSDLSAVPLTGALAILFWANLQADRSKRAPAPSA